MVGIKPDNLVLGVRDEGIFESFFKDEMEHCIPRKLGAAPAYDPGVFSP